MGFASGFQAGLAGVKQAVDMRNERLMKEDFARIAEEKQMAQEAVDLQNLKNEQGQNYYQMGEVDAQGRQTFSALDPTTGEYKPVGVLPQSGRTQFLGQSYEQRLDPTQIQGLRRNAMIDTMMKYSPTEGIKAAEGLANIGYKQAQTERTTAMTPEEVRAMQADTALTGARTEGQQIQNTYDTAATPLKLEGLQAGLKETYANIDRMKDMTQQAKDELKYKYAALAQDNDQFVTTNTRLLSSLGIDAERLGIERFKAQTDRMGTEGNLALGNKKLDAQVTQWGKENDLDLIRTQLGERKQNFLEEMGRAELAMKEATTASDLQAAEQAYAANQFELDKLQDADAGLQLTYMADDLRTGDERLANQLIDKNRDLIIDDLKKTTGLDFDDMDIAEKDEGGFTLIFKKDGKEISRQGMSYNFLTRAGEQLMGMPSDDIASAQKTMTTAATIMKSKEATLDPQDLETDEAYQTAVSQYMAASATVNESASRRNRGLGGIYKDGKIDTYHINDTTAKDRVTGVVRSSADLGGDYTYPSEAAYNRAQQTGLQSALDEYAVLQRKPVPSEPQADLFGVGTGVLGASVSEISRNLDYTDYKQAKSALEAKIEQLAKQQQGLTR